MSYISKAIAIPSCEMLNKNPSEKDEKISSIVNFSRSSAYSRHINNKNWRILQKEPNFQEPLCCILYKEEKYLYKKLYNNKQQIYPKTFDKGKYHPCLLV